MQTLDALTTPWGKACTMKKQHVQMSLANLGFPAWQHTVSYPELWAGVREQMDLPEVVPGNQEALIIAPADGVDVGAVWAVGPQAWGEGDSGNVYWADIKTQTHTCRGRVMKPFTYRRPGSPECRCRWSTRCLWWSPHWPPVYTLTGSLGKHTQGKYTTCFSIK